MQLALHHFFILVAPGAEVAERLIALGMKERSLRRRHLGQGTENRCFDFANTTLELLWLHDEAEAETGPAHGLRLPERWRDTEASPFGLIVNRRDNVSATMPFAGWSYHPDYFKGLGESWFFHVGENANNLVEPLCFYAPFVDPLDVPIDGEQEVFKSVEQVIVHTPADPMSEVVGQLSAVNGLSIVTGPHLLEVFFAEPQLRQGFSEDLRPGLPLIIHW